MINPPADASYVRSYVRAARWANVGKAIRDAAWTLGLQADIEVDKGWVRETTRFCVWGDAEKVRTFWENFQQAIKEYEMDG